MQLSEFTVSVLKNFADINNGIYLQEGNKQRTISVDDSIMAEVSLEENFPNAFGIYDLNQFIGNVCTLKEPELEFDETYVTCRDKDFSLKYFACAEKMVKAPDPKKKLVLNNPTASVELKEGILIKAKKLADMNALPHMSFVGKDGKVSIVSHEKGNDTSNSISTELGEYEGPDFTSTIKTENLKVIPGDYTLNFKSGAPFVELVHKTKDIRYFVAFVVNRGK